MECGSDWVVKNGHTNRGKQLYKCKRCGRQFVPEANTHKHPKTKAKQALNMYTSGMSIRAISQTLNVKQGTVFT
ncbi:MAG: IS1/IS1595 family N-terminal zinc-binding domain-containing protein [Fervidobacterium sp.]